MAPRAWREVGTVANDDAKPPTSTNEIEPLVAQSEVEKAQPIPSPSRSFQWSWIGCGFPNDCRWALAVVAALESAVAHCLSPRRSHANS